MPDTKELKAASLKTERIKAWMPLILLFAGNITALTMQLSTASQSNVDSKFDQLNRQVLPSVEQKLNDISKQISDIKERVAKLEGARDERRSHSRHSSRPKPVATATMASGPSPTLEKLKAFINKPEETSKQFKLPRINLEQTD